MSGRIERVQVRIGKQPSLAANAGGGWCGIPGRTLERGFASLPAASSLSDPNLMPETGVLLRIPKKGHSDGPVRAIAIASDSPVEAADLYFNGDGGVNVFRISPGCPWVGQLSDNDQVRVVPIREIPYLGLRDSIAVPGDVMTFAEFALQTLVWDCTVVPDSTLPIDGGAHASVLIPIRLEIYRGDLQPHHVRRAPYNGSLLWLHEGGCTDPRFIVITDGRRRVSVVAGGDSAAGTVQIFGLDATKGEQLTIPNGLLLAAWSDVPLYTELLAPTAIPAAAADQMSAPLTFQYAGNPYFAFVVQIDGAVAGDAGYIHVHTWDE